MRFESEPVYIGPSRERQLFEQRSALARASRNLISEIQHEKDEDEALKDTYGEDLRDSALAYASRVGTSSGWVHYKGEQVQFNEVRPIFAADLIKAALEQPDEERAEWVDGLFKVMDRRHSPYSY